MGIKTKCHGHNATWPKLKQSAVYFEMYFFFFFELKMSDVYDIAMILTRVGGVVKKRNPCRYL